MPCGNTPAGIRGRRLQVHGNIRVEYPAFLPGRRIKRNNPVKRRTHNQVAGYGNRYVLIFTLGKFVTPAFHFPGPVAPCDFQFINIVAVDLHEW